MICNPLLQFVKAHLRNTEHLLRNLQNMKNGELKNKFLFSLDVVSLYPSVNNDAAIDTLRLYLEREKKNIQLYQFSTCIWHHPINQSYLRKELFLMEAVFLPTASRSRDGKPISTNPCHTVHGQNRKSSNLLRSVTFHLHLLSIYRRLHYSCW